MARDPKFRKELLREGAGVEPEHPERKRAITVPANAWLGRLVRQSPAFEAKVAEDLAALNVAQDLMVLRESRGWSQTQLARRSGVTRSAIAQLESAHRKNIELRALVRIVTALGAHLKVSIRPHRQAALKGHQPLRAKKSATARPT